MTPSQTEVKQAVEKRTNKKAILIGKVHKIKPEYKHYISPVYDLFIFWYSVQTKHFKNV